MPANHKVSVAWQIVFFFIPILGFWAFYRIRKLRKLLLYVVLPGSIFVLAFDITFKTFSYEKPPHSLYYYLSWVLPPYDFNYPQIILTVGSWLFNIFSIYLIIRWSRQHNKQFDQPTQQPTEP